MNLVSNVIILAAGKANELDGLNKVLIKNPVTGLSILEHLILAFSGKKVTVVVGYRGVQIMQSYPKLNYVINHDWAISSNAMSLGLALTDEPTYVVSGDMIFDKELIDQLDRLGNNVALTERRENRTLSAVHCVLNEDDDIVETYQGEVRDVNNPEAIGLFKISDTEVLKKWKSTSIKHGNLFVGQTLPCSIGRIKSVLLNDHSFIEINTTDDYLRLLEGVRGVKGD
jgi:choline kinase